MNGYDLYCRYMAIKLHFSSPSYDYFKYHGKLKSANPKSYDKRKDKYMFQKLARRLADNEVNGYLVANFINNDHKWTSDLLEPDSKDTYNRWQSRIDALDYMFEQEFRHIHEEGDISSQLTPIENDYPKVFKMILSNEISMETLIILNAFTKCIDRWDESYKDDYIYSTTMKRIKKYAPFLELNLESKKEIAKKVLTSH